MLRIITRAVLAAVMLATGSPLPAASPEDRPAVEAGPEQSWYYNQPTDYQPNPRAIIHHKAMTRSAERHARLASMSWYGMCNSRPRSTATPFTSVYSPTWQMPGGRPFAWFTSQQPTYVVWR